MAGFIEPITCPACSAAQTIAADELEPDDTFWAFERCGKCDTPFVSRWETPAPVVTVHKIDGITTGGQLDGE